MFLAKKAWTTSTSASRAQQNCREGTGGWRRFRCEGKKKNTPPQVMKSLILNSCTRPWVGHSFSYSPFTNCSLPNDINSGAMAACLLPLVRVPVPAIRPFSHCSAHSSPIFISNRLFQYPVRVSRCTPKSSSPLAFWLVWLLQPQRLRSPQL